MSTPTRIPDLTAKGLRGLTTRLAAVVLALLAVPAMAATIAVNTTADELDFIPNGSCSLREAVVTVNEARDVGVGGCTVTGGSLGNDDVIVVPAGLYELTRITGVLAPVDQDADNLDLLADVTIRGAGAQQTVIDGDALYIPTASYDLPLWEGGVVRVASGVAATIEGVTLRNGWALDGGGVAVLGNLTLIDSAVEHNRSDAEGGGVFNTGSLALRGVTVAENRAGADDGIPHGGGGIYSSGALDVVNSTISSNEAGFGGGIFLGEASSQVILSSVTISANVANGGAVFTVPIAGGLDSAASAANVRVEATLIAGNEASGENAADCSGAFDSVDYNLIGDATHCTGFTATNDETGTAASPIDPLLSSLGLHGGNTRTHALRAGSSAIDGAGLGIVESCLAVDQRGSPRPIDGDGNGFTHCDVGAYEAPENSAPQANVSVESLVSTPDDVVGAGGALRYEVGVRNYGPDTATDVSYTLELPAGTGVPGALPGGCSAAGVTISCALGDLSPSTLNLETFEVTAPSTTGVAITRATVSTTAPDPNTADDVLTDTVTVTSATSSDLSLAMTGPSSVVRGATIEYRLTVRNAGPQTSGGDARVTDRLPTGTTFVSASTGCSRANDLVTCVLDPLPAGASQELSIVVQAPDRLTTVTNTASVSSSADDLIDNNSAAFGTRVVDPPPPQADLFIQKLGPSVAEVGSQLSYALVVHNNGPDPATAVRVRDTLPVGVTVTSLPGECSQEGRTITCELGTLALGDPTVNLPIVATAPATPGDILNSATVSDQGDSEDPYPASNDSAVVTRVTTEPPPPGVDLGLTKSAPATVLPGADLRYTITVTNHGTDTAHNVVVTDNLPEGVTYETASAGCAQSGGAVECDLGDLPSGASQVLAIDVTAPEAQGPITNSASVDSDADDVNPGNEADTAATTVSATPPEGSASLMIAAYTAGGSAGPVGPDDKGVVMLAFSATAGASEGVSINSLSVSASGTAGAEGLAQVALYPDVDGDGAADDGATALAIGTFASSTNETLLVLAQPESIAASGSSRFVLAVDFGSQAAGAPAESERNTWFVWAILLASPVIFTRRRWRGASRLLIVTALSLVCLTSCFTEPGDVNNSHQLTLEAVSATGELTGIDADVSGLPIEGEALRTEN